MDGAGCRHLEEHQLYLWALQLCLFLMQLHLKSLRLCLWAQQLYLYPQQLHLKLPRLCLWEHQLHLFLTQLHLYPRRLCLFLKLLDLWEQLRKAWEILRCVSERRSRECPGPRKVWRTPGKVCRWRIRAAVGKLRRSANRKWMRMHAARVRPQLKRMAVSCRPKQGSSPAPGPHVPPRLPPRIPLHSQKGFPSLAARGSQPD
jgi:hypothetical protein